VPTDWVAYNKVVCQNETKGHCFQKKC
jgi:hypothetical protein